MKLIADLTKQAKNDFEKYLFKLMNAPFLKNYEKFGKYGLKIMSIIRKLKPAIPSKTWSNSMARRLLYMCFRFTVLSK